MPMEVDFEWMSTALSHVGKVRGINEDAVLDRPDLGLWVVADGMGGHAAGDVASRMIVTELEGIETPDDMEKFIRLVSERLELVNLCLRETALIADHSISGSTVAALLVFGSRAAAVWAGDSRVYVYRGNRLRQLSQDHSQVREWVEMGLLEPEEARHHPDSNIITRAVGAMDHLELETHLFDVQPGDTYLLCSDGLYNEVSEQEMETALITGDCVRAAQQLLGLVLSRKARDNVSIVVARVDEGNDLDEMTMLNPAISLD